MPNIQILSSDESVVGSLRFTICHDREDLEKCHKFKTSIPSLEQCLHYVGMNEEYPMAFLDKICVDEDYRRNINRYGLTLMHRFEEISTEFGCKMTACKVGWPEGWSSSAGNILFYNKCDWRLYDLPAESVMAFKVLDAKAPRKLLMDQSHAKMIVYLKDENLEDPLAPTPVGKQLIRSQHQTRTANIHSE